MADDPERLRQQLEAEPALLGLAADIAHSRPHLFSATAVTSKRGAW